jgi:hypothetical protein
LASSARNNHSIAVAETAIKAIWVGSNRRQAHDQARAQNTRRLADRHGGDAALAACHSSRWQSTRWSGGRIAPATISG